jgi:hypothetical protein
MYNIPGVSDVRDVRADPAAGQVTHSILRLSSALEKLYQLDMMVRPPGVAERLKLQMDTAQAQIAKGGGPFSGTSSNADDVEEIAVEAGALDKEWDELTDSELVAAVKLGYTAATFAESVPPLVQVS